MASNGTMNLTTTNVSGTTGTLRPGNPVTLAGGTVSLTLDDLAGGVRQLSVALAAINPM